MDRVSGLGFCVKGFLQVPFSSRPMQRCVPVPSLEFRSYQDTSLVRFKELGASFRIAGIQGLGAWLQTPFPGRPMQRCIPVPSVKFQVSG